jgi:hypothetical protein
MLWRSSLTSIWRMSTPSTSSEPPSASYRPTMSLASELLPEPLRPMMPIFSPGRMVRLMFFSARFCWFG